MKWIDVKVELPKDGILVLVYIIEKKIITDKKEWILEGLFRYNKGWYIPYNETQDFFIITHWMPLPEPPKEDEE